MFTRIFRHLLFIKSPFKRKETIENTQITLSHWLPAVNVKPFVKPLLTQIAAINNQPVFIHESKSPYFK
jgi:hypothetical protein